MTATQTRTATRPLLGPAFAAGAAATVLSLAGMYLDTPWKGHGNKDWAVTTDHDGLVELVLTLGFVAAGLAVVFGVVVTRGLHRPAEAEARRSLALAVTGVLSVVVFWTGLPIILAIGALVLASDARARLGRIPATASIAMALAILTAVAAVQLALVG
jgi:heme/copper-type cytochrome/quinol oxidase subunit 2